MAYISLDCCRVDYLTLTSYDEKWFNFMIDYLMDDTTERVETRSNGYDGMLCDFVSGHMFFGKGYQRGKPHYKVSVSGELAHWVAGWATEICWARDCTCSRLDAQITVMMPSGWSQKNLRNRLERKGNRCGFPTPKSKSESGLPLETVYIGVREKTDRYYRVYMKELEGGDIALRCEVELKKRRSRAIWNEWRENSFDVGILRAELVKLADKDKKLSRLILDKLENISPTAKVRTNDSNTARWIINDVMPIIERILMSHTSESVGVIQSIYEVLEKYHESKNR